MLALGAFVMILWPGTELHGCTGRLVAQEQHLTAIKDIKCPNGAEFIDAVGVPDRTVIEVDVD